MNANDLFIVAERVNSAIGSGVNVGHVDELEKGLSGNDVVLKGEVNAGKLCLVEDSGSGGFGLPGVVLGVEEQLARLFEVFRGGRRMWCVATEPATAHLASSAATTERIPMSHRRMDPGISRMLSRVFEKWKLRNSFFVP
ncbi:hypothetical protein AVEN_164605-1 [Araneus ventricosus]|uniref:Uncharacterized protein n=1 Tax=Araneus ventricosus TaxID=182803 RepID=A0A4Y2B4R3_ARAVE|nr:hypothetical protein AVEN_164605-1 [Araneus ventricosus]